MMREGFWSVERRKRKDVETGDQETRKESQMSAPMMDLKDLDWKVRLGDGHASFMAAIRIPISACGPVHSRHMFA
jgi:hypothetical protein